MAKQSAKGWIIFEFDTHLPNSLFAIESPQGYELTRIERRDNGADENLVLSAKDGLGPVKFGMSAEEVRLALGKPDVMETKPAMTAKLVDGKPVIIPGKGFELVPADPPYDNVILRYRSRGFMITVSSVSGVTHIRAFDKAFGLGCNRFAGQTDDGIRIGMTEKEVKRKLDVTALPKERFVFRNGTVSQIVVTHRVER